MRATYFSIRPFFELLVAKAMLVCYTTENLPSPVEGEISCTLCCCYPDHHASSVPDEKYTCQFEMMFLIDWVHPKTCVEVHLTPWTTHEL